MWFQFEECVFEEGRTGRSGNKYNAWVLRGKRKGFQGEPDTPYEKVVFENTTGTVIEKGITRPDCSVLQFFQKAVHPGDIVKIKYVRNGQRWDFGTLEKLNEYATPTYEPLTETQVAQIKQAQSIQAASIPSENLVPSWVR